METHAYVLEGISVLRGLSITEIVVGMLGIIGGISAIYQTSIVSALSGTAVSIFLLITGMYGVRTVKLSREAIVTSRCFRGLFVMNAIICVIYILSLLVLTIGCILLAVDSAGLLELYSSGNSSRKSENILRTLLTNYLTITTVILVIIVLMAIGMIVLTGMAAWISYKNEMIIEGEKRGADVDWEVSDCRYKYTAVNTIDSLRFAGF